VHTPSATQSPNADIFRRAVKTQHKENQYRLADHDKYTYLKREVARRVAGRVQDIKREFTDVLDVGCGKGFVTQALLEQSVLTPSSSSPVSITLADSSQSAIREAEAALTGSTVWDDKHVSLNFVCHDEDDALAPHADLVFPEGQYDLVVASMSSHWVNKLPSLFAQVRKSLKPDGCFMVAMLGGESLQELRSALTLAGLERMGGVAALISPFAQQKDLGDVLASSGEDRIMCV
jgi:NADH dehydrogenase [ubiquinone] 1 alpha subcomplex assembly factor 5